MTSIQALLNFHFNLTGCGPSLTPTNVWVFPVLNLLSPTQLSANHRMDHRCWEQLWPMSGPRVTPGVIMTSWNAFCKAALLFLSLSAVNLQPSHSLELPVGFQLNLQLRFCPQEWLLAPGDAALHIFRPTWPLGVCMQHTILQSWLSHLNSSTA